MRRLILVRPDLLAKILVLDVRLGTKSRIRILIIRKVKVNVLNVGQYSLKIQIDGNPTINKHKRKQHKHQHGPAQNL